MAQKSFFVQDGLNVNNFVVANSSTLSVGANLTLNSTSLSIGNSTVNATLNSTSFSGTANLATYINAQYGLLSNSTGVFVVANSGIVANTSGVFVNPSLSLTNLTVSGNLIISGTMTEIDTINLNVYDNMLALAGNLASTNTFLDTVDTGWYVKTGNTSVNWYSGMARVAASSTNTNPFFKLFATQTLPGSNIIDTGASIGTLQAWLNANGATVNSTVFAVGNSTVNTQISTTVSSFSGNVGIGTNSANASLHVYRANSMFVTILESNSADSYNRFVSTAGIGEYGIWQGALYFQAFSLSNGIRFYGNSSTNSSLSIASNGNIGVSTTSPGDKLEIVGSAASWAGISGIRFTDISGNANSRNWGIYAGGANYGDLNFYMAAAANSSPSNANAVLTISRTGYVGIGTTSPQALFQIGDGTNTSTLTYQSNSPSDPQLSFNAYWTGSQWNRINTAYGAQNWWHDAVNNVLYLRMASSGANPITWNATSLFIDANTGPYGASLLTVRNTGAAGEAAISLRNDVGYAAFELFGSTWGASGISNMALFTTQSTIAGGIGFATLGSAPIKFMTNSNGSSNERMRILADGKIGIGTSTPGEVLEVTGNIKATTTKGVILDAADRPLITRGWDAFSSGNYSGIGRWGLFMESGSITIGSPAGAGNFKYSTYNADSSISTTPFSVTYNSIVQLGVAGGQYRAYNQDTVKLKFANWYISNADQWGQGQLWNELWYGAINNNNARRIGFYLDLPDAGASDSSSGQSGVHPTNARMYIDMSGVTVPTGTLVVGNSTVSTTISPTSTALMVAGIVGIGS